MSVEDGSQARRGDYRHRFCRNGIALLFVRRWRLNDPSVDPCSYCPIARQDWRSPVVHETQALGAAGTLWSNALLARRGTEKCSARMASTSRSVSTVGVPTVLLRRSLPAELLPYIRPRNSPKSPQRKATPEYSGGNPQLLRMSFGEGRVQDSALLRYARSRPRAVIYLDGLVSG